MYEKKVAANQSIYDLAIQEYGDVEAIFTIADDNPETFTAIDIDIPIGTVLKFRVLPADAGVTDVKRANYFRSLSQTIATI